MPPKKQAATALAASIAEFEARYAKDMGHPLVQPTIRPYEVISTGSLNLDYALRTGGWVEGRIHEVWGPEHAGKTTLGNLGVAQAQMKHEQRRVAWIDMEQTYDTAWAASLGVDLSRLWLEPNPKTAEDVADATRRFVESGLCSLVVLDSVGGMISKAEFEKEADEAVVANVARIVTRMVKQCAPIARQNGTTLIVVNQVRANIAKYGPSTTTSGGWALKHITTSKVSVRRGGDSPKTVTIDGDAVPVGYPVVCRVEKNKCAPYGPTATFWLFNQDTEKYGPVGVDQKNETWDFGTRLGIIERSGAYYTLPDGERVHTADKAMAYLFDRPALLSQVRTRVLASLADQLREEAIDSDAGAEHSGFVDLSAVAE